MNDYMNERPILFSGPMVRAILAGHKTQTRRVIRCCCNTMHINRLLGDWSLSESPRQWDGKDDIWQWTGKRPVKPGDWIEVFQTDVDDNATAPVRCNFKAGDHLWVRETWAVSKGGGRWAKGTTLFRADHGFTHGGTEMDLMRWKPSIFMPRHASRLTLEITSVRVERVQEISEADAVAEGYFGDGLTDYGRKTMKPRSWFWAVWDGINAKRGAGWDANPWVWVIHFKKIAQTTCFADLRDAAAK